MCEKNPQSSQLLEDVELSFKLFEYSIRSMCYAELGEIRSEIFGRDLQLNQDEENVVFPEGEFANAESIVRASYMAVGAAFGSTAICLDCLLQAGKFSSQEMKAGGSLISAVRNAFSHGIAAPRWYVKQHKFEVLNLEFIGGPAVDLEALNGQEFSYSHIGGLAVWFRLKQSVIDAVENI